MIVIQGKKIKLKKKIIKELKYKFMSWMRSNKILLKNKKEEANNNVLILKRMREKNLINLQTSEETKKKNKRNLKKTASRV